MATAHVDRMAREITRQRGTTPATAKNKLVRTVLLMKDEAVRVGQSDLDRLTDVVSHAILSGREGALATADGLRAYKLKLIVGELYSTDQATRVGRGSVRWWSAVPGRAPLETERVISPKWPSVSDIHRAWLDPSDDLVAPALWRGGRVHVVIADYNLQLQRVALCASGHEYWLTRDEFVGVVAEDPLLASARTVVLAGHHTGAELLADQVAARVGLPVYGYTSLLSQQVRHGRTFLAPIPGGRTSLPVGTWARSDPGHLTEQAIRGAAQQLGSTVLEPLVGENGEIFGYNNEVDGALHVPDHFRSLAALRDVWVTRQYANAEYQPEYSYRAPWDRSKSYWMMVHGPLRPDGDQEFAVTQKDRSLRAMGGTEFAREVLLAAPGLISNPADELVLFSCNSGSAGGARSDPLRNVALAQLVINELKGHFAKVWAPDRNIGTFSHGEKTPVRLEVRLLAEDRPGFVPRIHEFRPEPDTEELGRIARRLRLPDTYASDSGHDVAPPLLLVMRWVWNTFDRAVEDHPEYLDLLAGGVAVDEMRLADPQLSADGFSLSMMDALLRAQSGEAIMSASEEARRAAYRRLLGTARGFGGQLHRPPLGTFLAWLERHRGPRRA